MSKEIIGVAEESLRGAERRRKKEVMLQMFRRNHYSSSLHIMYSHTFKEIKSPSSMT